jgi:type I restriction enzyme, S subunit
MSPAPKAKIEEVETGTDAPEGWALATLADVCNVNPPRPNSDALPADAPVSFVPMPAVDAGLGAITGAKIRPFSRVRKGFTAFANNDVIIAKITPCMENGKAAVARDLPNGVGFGSTEFHVLRSTGSVLPNYIYHFIRQDSFRRAAENEMTGSVGQKRVPVDFINDAEIPLPPLAEQERIVNVLNHVVIDTRSVRNRLGRLSVKLKYFRQAVLVAACSGKLTEDWREKNRSSETSDALLRRILQSRKQLLRDKCKEPKIPSEPLEDYQETWTPATLDQLTWLITSGSRGWARYYSDSGADFIRAENINSDRLNISEIAHVKLPTAVEGSRTRVSLNDLLITITGANVTKSAVVDQQLENAYVSQHVALVRPVDSDTSRFLYLWIVSPLHGRRKLLDDAYGAGKPGLNLDNIREAVVVLPPLQEQHEIVRRVEALFKLAEAIEKRVAAANARAERLTQAILAKAFRGELVPTEAELARREGREYEPASVLLERIKAERAAAEAGKGKKARAGRGNEAQN